MWLHGSHHGWAVKRSHSALVITSLIRCTDTAEPGTHGRLIHPLLICNQISSKLTVSHPAALGPFVAIYAAPPGLTPTCASRPSW